MQNPLREAQPKHAGKPAAHEIQVAREVEKATQEIQAMLTVAKKFPRDEVAAADAILAAVSRREVAANATYSYQRGGTPITGLSVRALEICAQAWGNIDSGFREISRADGESIVEAWAWDMQTNTRNTKLFTVKHVRDTKRGAKSVRDERDIYELIANQASRRVRSCLESLIPIDVRNAALENIRATMAKNEPPPAKTIRSMLTAFAKHNITRETLEKWAEVPLEKMNNFHVEHLKEINQRLNNRTATPGDFFDIPEPDAAQEAAESKAAADDFFADADKKPTKRKTAPKPGDKTP